MSLEAREVCLSYQDIPALQGVSLQMRPGEFVGLLGPNGAGKSSLLKVLAGLVRATSGEVLLEGRPVASYPRRELARRVALVPQSTPYSFPFTVEEVVMMGRYPYLSGLGLEEGSHRPVVEQCLQATGTLALRGRRVHQLSGGESQRVRIAQALAQETGLLLLDEPTAHLDLAFQVEILGLLARLNRERSLGVVTSLHDLNLAGGFCSRLVILAGGRVVADGPPVEVLTRERIEAVFGVAVEVQVDGELPRVHPRRTVFKSC